MQAIAYKNGGLVGNWCALYLAIYKNYTSDKALTILGIKNVNPKIEEGRRNAKQLKKKTVNEIDINKARMLYDEGYTIAKVARVLKTRNGLVSEAIKKSGGNLRQRGRRKGCQKMTCKAVKYGQGFKRS